MSPLVALSGHDATSDLRPLSATLAYRDFMSTRPNTTLADFERHGIPESVFQ